MHDKMHRQGLIAFLRSEGSYRCKKRRENPGA
jgi:hypothetical protein